MELQKGPLFHLKVNPSCHCTEEEENKQIFLLYLPSAIQGLKTRLERGFLEILQHLGGRISAETWPDLSLAPGGRCYMLLSW